MKREINCILSHVESHDVIDKSVLKKTKRSSFNRPQCYGGNGGVLLSTRRSFEEIKKKQSDPIIVSDSCLLITRNVSGSQLSSLSTTRVKSTFDELDCNNEYLAESKETEESKKAQLKTQTQERISNNAQLIGWDDVLCRPIYQRKAPTAIALSASSGDDDNDSLNSGASLSSEESESTYTLNEDDNFISFGIESLLTKKKTGRRSSYGRNRKGKLLGLSVVTQTILAQCDRNSNCTKDVSSSAPAHNNHSIQSTAMDVVEERIQLPNSQRSHKPALRKLKKSDLKSLALARSFFENLDTTEVLNVQSISSDNDECDKIPGLRSVIPVRTRRVLNVTNPELRSQYSLYYKSVKESGVEPISIEEFAKFRGNYFKKSGMCDGILEED